MYKHLLVPTDGSALADKGVRAAIRLAKALKARITTLYVASPYASQLYGEAAIYYSQQVSRAEHAKSVAREAKKILGAVERAARAAGVPCRTRLATELQPWEAIVKAARGCDAIVMASHGRGAVGGLLLGSETSRVLAHSKIPVLVCR